MHKEGLNFSDPRWTKLCSLTLASPHKKIGNKDEESEYWTKQNKTKQFLFLMSLCRWYGKRNSEPDNLFRGIYSVNGIPVTTDICFLEISEFEE